ncbi:hypothetical protein KM043_013076 [Ampulex compressa]|nr:hypothetical protein KM043_013076 [Ampulex compressa]
MSARERKSERQPCGNAGVGGRGRKKPEQGLLPSDFVAQGVQCHRSGDEEVAGGRKTVLSRYPPDRARRIDAAQFCLK